MQIGTVIQNFRVTNVRALNGPPVNGRSNSVPENSTSNGLMNASGLQDRADIAQIIKSTSRFIRTNVVKRSHDFLLHLGKIHFT